MDMKGFEKLSCEINDKSKIYMTLNFQNNTISISRKGVEALNQPKFVNFLYNWDKHILVIKETNVMDINAFPFYKGMKNAVISRKSIVQALTSHFKTNYHSRCFEGKYSAEDNALIFDLNELEKEQ